MRDLTPQADLKPPEPHQQPQPHLHRDLLWAASVPAALLLGIVIALVLHGPLYLGLWLGIVAAFIYGKPRQTLRHLGLSAIAGVRRLWKVCVALLLIGAVVAVWMQSGVIGQLMQAGTHLVSPNNVVWMAFLLTAMLSLIMGSAIATWSVLGPPLMALSPPALWPLVAGALVSGGMVGDRSSPMSTSVLVIASACQLPYRKTLGRLNLTAILPFVLALVAFIVVNATMLHGVHSAPVAAISPRGQWLLYLPPALVVVLALARVPLLWNLVLALVIAFVYVIPLHLDLHTLLHVVWSGSLMPPQHALDHAVHHSHAVGGLAAMVSADELIVSAGIFQGLCAASGAMEVLSQWIFDRVSRNLSFVATAYGVCLLFSITMGSQMLAVLMSGNTLEVPWQQRDWPKDWLLQVVGDAAELLPALIPWNLLGLQATVILATATTSFLPDVWFIWMTLACSVIRVLWSIRRRSRCVPSTAQTAQ